MLDDWMLSLIYAALVALSTMPVAVMLGSECSPCCGGCGLEDGKTRSDPADEGTWVPSGTWESTCTEGVTWTFTENPGDGSGETWFFFGDAVGSNSNDLAIRQDWGNICNWYSSKTTAPNNTTALSLSSFNKRATRLPPANAVVHIYSSVHTQFTGPVTVKAIYHWNADLGGFNFYPFNATTTGTVYDSSRGTAVLRNSRFYQGTINGGVLCSSQVDNTATVNGGADFILGGFLNISGVVNGGATFTCDAENRGTVNGGATFSDASKNLFFGRVNGGATFNDSACSIRTTGFFGNSPCDRKFVAHPTDLPTCNGTAPSGCANGADTCGCG